MIVSLVVYTYFYYSLPASLSVQELMAAASGEYIVKLSNLPVAICEAFIAVYMTIYCLLLARQLLNKQSRVLKLIADSSYWVYLIHLPLLLVIQFALANVEMNMWLEFLLSTFATFFIGVVSYLLLVKRTPIGWLLNGRKKKSSDPVQQHNTEEVYS